MGEDGGHEDGRFREKPGYCSYKCVKGSKARSPGSLDVLLLALSRSPVGTLAFTLPAEGSQVDSRGRYPKSHRIFEEIPGHRSKLNNIELVEAACAACDA